MIERIYLKSLVLCAIALTTSHGTKLNSNEAEAKMFLNETSDELFSFYDEIGKDQISASYFARFDFAEYESIFLNKIVMDSKKFDYENFKDYELKYAFEVLSQLADIKIIELEQIKNVFSFAEDLYLILLKDKVTYISDSEKTRAKLLHSVGIKNNTKTSHEPKEFLYYWKVWREISENFAETYFDTFQLLKALKDAAALNNLSPLEFWLRGFNITEMEQLMADIQPLYVEFHALIRNLLRKKYGESIIAADGLIPEHLLEEVLHQAKTNESIIEEIFPYDELPPVESVMAEGFEAQQLYEIAEAFYESLGFEKYPSSVWGDRIKQQMPKIDSKKDENDKSVKSENDEEDDDEKDGRITNDDDEDDECYPRVLYWTPKILLEFCEKMKFEDFLNAYAHMGNLHYAKEMVGLPAYFFKAPRRLEHAIGKAVILSSSTHHNLKSIGMISDDFNITQDVEMNRLLRMAIPRLIKIPLNFVYMKLMADLLSGNVSNEDLSKHYWHLMDKYVGVGPPKGHDVSSATYDIPLEFYNGINENLMSLEFSTRILSFQIHKKLCELSGKYPQEQLHLCDINGSKDAGNALKKIMQLGSSKPFKEVLAAMFPENPTVRAESLLEYYEPLKKLLVEKNKEANVEPGWKTSDSNKSSFFFYPKCITFIFIFVFKQINQF